MIRTMSRCSDCENALWFLVHSVHSTHSLDSLLSIASMLGMESMHYIDSVDDRGNHPFGRALSSFIDGHFVSVHSRTNYRCTLREWRLCSVMVDFRNELFIIEGIEWIVLILFVLWPLRQWGDDTVEPLGITDNLSTETVTARCAGGSGGDCVSSVVTFGGGICIESISRSVLCSPIQRWMLSILCSLSSDFQPNPKLKRSVGVRIHQSLHFRQCIRYKMSITFEARLGNGHHVPNHDIIHIFIYQQFQFWTFTRFMMLQIPTKNTENVTSQNSAGFWPKLRLDSAKTQVGFGQNSVWFWS